MLLAREAPHMSRPAILAASALAAAALLLALSLFTDAGRAVFGQAERASLEADAQGSGALRHGAGTVGPRNAAVSGRRTLGPRAPQAGLANADSDPDASAPVGDPGPRDAEVAGLEGDDATGMLGVESIPPPERTPLRSPPPRIPDPTVIAGVGAPPVPATLPTPDSTPPPDPGSEPGENATPEPGEPTPSEPTSPGEPVPSQGPLSEAEVEARVDEALADVPPEQRAPLEPILRQDIATKSRAAADFTR
jgi:hypothetical protein